MGLPNSREALPNGPGSIIPSSTILAIEDCVIAINRLLGGQAQGFFPTNVTLLGTLTVGGGRVAFNATTPASLTLSGALATVSVPGGGDTGPILNPDGVSGGSRGWRSQDGQVAA